MILQWGEYGTVPQAVRDLIASKIAMLDEYILMQTGENEYSALVLNPFNRECVRYRVYRTDNYNRWTVETVTGADWSYQITNEYYVYSNRGVGTQLALPVHDAMIAHASAFICVALMFAILFKGVLFPCLLGKRRKDMF